MKIVLLVAAVTAFGFAQPASATENGLVVRAASSLGALIASQGNAALLEIREEISKDWAERMKPYLPAPTPAAPDREAARSDSTS